MGNICAQNEYTSATLYALTMRREAGFSQLLLNLSSLIWRAVPARLFEVCDRKLWHPVLSTARHQSRELDPAAELLGDFAYTWSRASINHLDESLFEGWLCRTLMLAGCPSFGTGKPLQQNLSFEKNLFSLCHNIPLVSQPEREQALVSTQCLPGSVNVCVCKCA